MNQVCSKRGMLLALMIVLVASIAFGQSDLGSIAGFVKDPSGSTVPNAKVTVKNQSGLERQANTNESGYFIITNIPAGTYAITVESAGFKKFESPNNKLDASATLSVDATLTVGAATETVEVTAQAANLQTESASVQRNVTRQQIDSLELNGRNPIFMANLVPGTRGGNLSGLSFNFSQGPSNINGARTQESLITYDGAPAVRTRSNGTSLGSADVDSTSEIQILTANYNPEYGRSSGGQIRIISKTGTQQFHGAAYDYVRNTIFNANTWTRNHTLGPDFLQLNQAAPIQYNQFGYNIGGPAYIPGKFNSDKSKIFWYWGQEWVRYRFTDTSSQTVPSLLMRQGNFSELLNPTNVYYGKVVTINDPTTGTPFPGNVIPTNRLSANGLGILNAWPKPNLASPINTSQFWYLAKKHPQNQRKDTLSADFNITDKQRVQFRRMNFAFWEYQPLDGGTDETPKYFNRPNQTNSLSHVWTVSANKVNEILATVSLDDVYIPVDQANFLDRGKVGINYPYIFPAGKLIPTRIPTVNMSSPFSGLSGGPYPSHSSGPIYTISDSFTWIKGSHTLKFGFNYEKTGENDNDEINVSACPTCTNNQNGQFSFTDTRSGRPTTGNSAANAALGLFDTYSELGQRAYTIFRGNMYEAFAQDGWKVSQKLHLDYGIRYSIITPMEALWRNMSAFDPKFYDPAKAVKIDPTTGLVIAGSGDKYNGMVIPGDGWPDSAKGRFPEASDASLNYLFRGVQKRFSDTQYKDFQPRIGLAYQITPKNVFRAGIGRFFTRLGVSDSIFLGGNPPFQPTANISFGSADNPGGTSANAPPLTVTTQSKSFRNPEAWAWNATFERQFYWNSVFSVAYVARRGLNLQREANINQPTPEVVAANPGVNLDALRPYKGYNSNRQPDNIARSLYQSFQFAYNKRFSSGLMFGVSYTLSKAMDNGSAQRDIIPDTYYADNLWGQSDFDVRHIFIANYVYELPIFRGQKGLAGKTLGGWQLSGIVQAQTGTPSSVAVGTDYVGVGQDGSMSNGGQFWAHTAIPDVVHQAALNSSNDPLYWFATKDSSGNPLFTQPAKGTFVHQDNVRNIVHNPGFHNWNVGLFKTFAIREKSGLQFRAEAFNVLNHPNWGGANFNPTSAAFGKVTGKTGDVRNMQLSLRLYF
jgi:hypothetical protein